MTLILIVSSFTLKSAILMTYYSLFTENFIENFCENKDRPELNCDGKCFLSKMLKKGDQQEKQRESIAISIAQLEYIMPNDHQAYFSLVDNVHKDFFFHRSTYLSAEIENTDKPPCLS